MDLGAPEPTCDQAASPRRIDILVANPALQARVLQRQLRWDLGIRTHAAQALRLRAGKLLANPVG